MIHNKDTNDKKGNRKLYKSHALKENLKHNNDNNIQICKLDKHFNFLKLL